MMQKTDLNSGLYMTSTQDFLFYI